MAGNPESLHPALEFIQRIALRSKSFREPAIGERHGFSGRGERGLGAETDKRIPPDLVILLRGFEKKRRRAPAQLGKCGDRRVAVRNNLGPDRHDPCCRRLLRKGGSRRTNHENETLGATFSAGFSIWNNSAAANWNVPAMMLVGKTSRFVL